MRYEEVSEIESTPFDEDILGELCSTNYGPAMLPDAYAALILLYYRKFDERYGTHLTQGVEISQVMPNREEDELDPVWLNGITEVMDAAIYSSGWDAVWLSADNEALREAIEWREEKKTQKRDFHDVYREYLDEILPDGFVKSCFLEEEEMAQDTAAYLEDGQIGIMWNKNLNRYMQYRAANKDMVTAICPDEDRHIMMLSKDVWEPYMITFYQDAREYEGKKYCRIALGSDGYSYCWYDCVNPNWICRAVKLGRMLNLALEKIKRYEAIKEEKAA